MNKKMLLITTIVGLLNVEQALAQWSLSGNANATNASKLGTTNAIPLRLFTNDQLRAYISSAGNFGIGTASPQQRLHVEGTSNQAIFVNTSALGSISGSGQIGYAKGTPTAAGNRLGYFLVGSRGGAENNFNTAGMAGYAAGAWTAGSSHPTYLTFETTPSGSTSRAERVRITASGNVGIGTTNPINKLHVVGRGRFTDGLTVSESGIYSVHTTGNGVEGYGNTSYGIGIYGNGYYGINGSGTAYGVIANGGTYGVYGSGREYGLYGYSNNYGVFGISPSFGVWGDGLYGLVGIGTDYGVYGYAANTGGYAGYFVGDIYVSGSYNPSDAKLKKNIESVTGALDILNKLNPKTYEFRQDGNFGLMRLPKGKHYGIMAQELEQVLPSMVANAKFDVGMTKQSNAAKPGQPEMAKEQQQTKEIIDYKAVNYTELIPVLVKAVQEQQAQITDQQKMISSLQEQVAALTKGKTGATAVSSATLGQVSPNPARGTARIAYDIPESAHVAQLVVTDALGRTIKVMRLTRSGVIDINTSGLSSGVYSYSLVVDNQTISTKKMTVVR